MIAAMHGTAISLLLLCDELLARVPGTETPHRESAQQSVGRWWYGQQGVVVLYL